MDVEADRSSKPVTRIGRNRPVKSVSNQNVVSLVPSKPTRLKLGNVREIQVEMRRVYRACRIEGLPVDIGSKLIFMLASLLKTYPQQTIDVIPTTYVPFSDSYAAMKEKLEAVLSRRMDGSTSAEVTESVTEPEQPARDVAPVADVSLPVKAHRPRRRMDETAPAEPFKFSGYTDGDRVRYEPDEL